MQFVISSSYYVFSKWTRSDQFLIFFDIQLHSELYQYPTPTSKIKMVQIRGQICKYSLISF